MRENGLERTRNLILLAVMLAGTVVLAASLGGAELRTGEPLIYVLQSLTEGLRAGESSGSQTALLTLIRVFILLYLYALIPLGILYTLLSPSGRKKLRRALAFTPIIFLLAYRFLQSDFIQRLDLDAAFNSSAGARPDEGIFVVTSIPSPPEWLGLAVSGSLTLLLAAAAWYVWTRIRPDSKKLDVIAEEARGAAEEIEAGRDFKDTVLRCYYQMGLILQERKILKREAAMTPREFATRLRGTGLPDEQVAQLTRIFESVRYGGRSAGDAERRTAVECLQAIAGAAGVAAMSRNELYLIVLVFFAVALAWALQVPVQEFLVTPLWEMGVLARYTLESIPQRWIWGGFVVIASLLAVRSLMAWQVRSRRPRLRSRPRPGPMEVWARAIHRAGTDEYHAVNLAQRIAALASEILAFRYRLEADEVLKNLEGGEFDLLPEVRAYLLRGLKKRSFLQGETDRGTAGAPPRSEELNRVVRFLEDQMEG